jgi:hypothetical protein
VKVTEIEFSNATAAGGTCKYLVEVLKEKRKFDGLIIRKVRVTRRVYGKGTNLIMEKNRSTQEIGGTKDDAASAPEE